MAASYEELTPGYEFPPTSYELSHSLISKYLEAVDGVGDGFVPPLAIAARAMTAITGMLSLPPGTIHASQDFEFYKLVPAAAVVDCQAKVVRKVSRGGMRMLVLELNVLDESKDKVQSGKATVILPP
jgi:hypothetical protein